MQTASTPALTGVRPVLTWGNVALTGGRPVLTGRQGSRSGGSGRAGPGRRESRGAKKSTWWPQRSVAAAERIGMLPSKCPSITENVTESRSEELVVRWTALTQGQAPARPQIPLAVLLGEAIDLAQLCDTHFEPTLSPTGRLPGLVLVEPSGSIHRSIATELRELTAAIGAVHAKCLSPGDREAQRLFTRARALESELRVSLAFVLDSGRHPGGAAQLGRMRTEYDSVRRRDELALALDGYAVLSRRYAALLAQVGVDSARIEEASTVADELRQQSAIRHARSSEGQRLLGLRNRLIGALYERIRTVRRAFRFVFRDHPEVVRRSVSSYERRRRARKGEGQAEASGMTSPG